MGSNTLNVVTVNPADEAKLRAALAEHQRLAHANLYLTAEETNSKVPRRMARSTKKALAQFDKDGNGKLSAAEKAKARAVLASKGFDDGADRQPAD